MPVFNRCGYASRFARFGIERYWQRYPTHELETQSRSSRHDVPAAPFPQRSRSPIGGGNGNLVQMPLQHAAAPAGVQTSSDA
jgi:hypothetical protein